MADQPVTTIPSAQAPTGPTKTCKKCKATIPKYSDRCPNCGANLKPVFKKAWFWVLIVVLLIVFGFASCTAAVSKSVSDAANGPSATGTSASNTTASSSSSSSAAKSSDADYSNMAVGTAVNLDSGLSVSVDAVQTGLANYDGKAMTCVTVTYANGGTKETSFNVYDWKAQDADGAQRSQGYYSDHVNDLSSGTLAAGGKVSGNIYFEGTPTKIIYHPSILSNSSNFAWVVG